MLLKVVWVGVFDLSFFIFGIAVLLKDVDVNSLGGSEIRSSYYNRSEECKRYIACLILARGGSKGIPLKNLAKLNGMNLLKRSLTTIFEFRKFDSVWVSTDNIDIGKEAMHAGARVHWRSAETATDNASSIMAVQEFFSFHPEVDVVALVQCSSPFLKVSFLEEAYSMMQTDQFDCVFSVTRQHKLRWKQLEDGSVKPLNFNPLRRPRRQDWAGELIENGMFYFARTSLISHGLLQGGRCGVVEIPQIYSLEVDTAFDLKMAALLDSLEVT